jgi:peptidoglycan/xylan/chitin deacetylase (PgdA/CDA1 family)
MIGVISKDWQRPVVEEFFQLFKIPWEFFNKEGTYEVIIVTEETIEALSAKLVIIFGSGTMSFDIKHSVHYYPKNNRGILLEYRHFRFPIYQDLTIFQTSSKPFMKVKDKVEIVGIEYIKPGQKILRIGYDLFDEIAFLLSKGQTVEYAQIPTLEIHIAMLRSWILDAGVSLIEIPPCPYGYDFIVCLTHDVDFLGIRNHKFDHTMYGFLYRALVASLISFLKRMISLDKLIKNWKAAFSLPLVYLGIIEDFMVQFERYLDIEKGLPATFFFIPHKNNPGQNKSGQAPKIRAAKYDVTDVIPLIKKLISYGHEVGLHGIDAWHDSARGRNELDRIAEIVGDSDIGVRMHWLYFSESSSKILEEAGFVYDSTLGYNDAIGYRSGTTQVFCLPETLNIFELPLNVMDTAMFYPKRMNLSESSALQLCKKLIDNVKTYRGVLTINWHERSLSPERNWDSF